MTTQRDDELDAGVRELVGTRIDYEEAETIHTAARLILQARQERDKWSEAHGRLCGQRDALAIERDYWRDHKVGEHGDQVAQMNAALVAAEAERDAARAEMAIAKEKDERGLRRIAQLEDEAREAGALYTAALARVRELEGAERDCNGVGCTCPDCPAEPCCYRQRKGFDGHSPNCRTRGGEGEP